PIDEDGFAGDEGLVDGAEIAAVVRHGAVVAEDEELSLWNRGLWHGTEIYVGGGDVGLMQEMSVDVDASFVDDNAVAGDGDDALDVALCCVARVAENDDVAAGDGFPSVDELVDEDAFLIFKSRQHAGAFHFHRLVEKDDEEDRDAERDDEVTDPGANDGELCGFCEWKLRLLRLEVLGHVRLL
ncbi:MAG: hypothetical protein JWO13_1993, partial [Acidobacteriales bacterium]|nr:hypothetical protein [Terriglobales bacterium]